jgi:hypothetical protein
LGRHDEAARLTSADDVGEIGLDGLVRDVAIPEGEHLPVDEGHGLVVAHEHSGLAATVAHLPGAATRPSRVPPQPPRLRGDDEVALGRVVDLPVLHELRQGVVDELAARALHRREGVFEGRAQRVQGGRLPLRGQLEDGPAEGLRQGRELALGDRRDQAVLDVPCKAMSHSPSLFISSLEFPTALSASLAPITS